MLSGDLAEGQRDSMPEAGRCHLDTANLRAEVGVCESTRLYVVKLLKYTMCRTPSKELPLDFFGCKGKDKKTTARL